MAQKASAKKKVAKKKKAAPKKAAVPKKSAKEKLAEKKAKAAERLERTKVKKSMSNVAARIKYGLFMDSQTGIQQEWTVSGHGVKVNSIPGTGYKVNGTTMTTAKQVIAAVAEKLFGDAKALDKKPKAKAKK